MSSPLAAVEAGLARLREDRLLQDDFRDGEVAAALEHWSGARRLPQHEAERRFNENYRVLAVLDKLRSLQAACAAVGLGTPLRAVLAGSTDPFYGLPEAEAEAERARFGLARQATPGSPSARPAAAGRSAVAARPAAVAADKATSVDKARAEAEGMAAAAAQVLAVEEALAAASQRATASAFAQPEASTRADAAPRGPDLFCLSPSNIALWWSMQLVVIAAILFY
jgi:hypothetical protein